MRFLLHRSNRAVLTKAGRKKNTGLKGKVPGVESGDVGQVVDTNDVNETCGDRHIQWGQQCNPSCGCVVRFQATVDPISKRYDAIDYVARQVLTRNSNGRRVSLLTARGRPMLKECQCGTLHHLASQVTSQLQGKTTTQAKNMLEFHSTRSSEAFRKTALAVQGLPSTDTSCFDVMEEALISMVKGYMPPFRQRRAEVCQAEQPNVTHFKGRGYHEWKQENNGTNDLDFSKFWDDYNVQNMAGPMSTLAMLDLSMSMISGKDEDEEEFGLTETLPQDWQAYVDQLYEEDEQQSA